MGFFKRILSKDSAREDEVKAVTMKPTDYSPKVIMAWVKAIEGDEEFSKYLLDHVEELFYATQALKLRPEAREWLMKNGFPQLMALVNAAEGNESAWTWLRAHKFHTFLHVGMAADGEMDSFGWLKHHATPDMFLLATSIKKLKDEIEVNHNDVHSFRKDL